MLWSNAFGVVKVRWCARLMSALRSNLGIADFDCSSVVWSHCDSERGEYKIATKYVAKLAAQVANSYESVKKSA